MQSAPSMADLIDAFDWNRTALGARNGWSPLLRLLVDILVQTRFPATLFWGRELLQIYNDAYRPLLGMHHPDSLGRSLRESRPDVWEEVGTKILRTLETGEPFWAEDLRIPSYRDGGSQEAYFTFAFSRIGVDGNDCGVVGFVIETTASVIREREFRAMSDTVATILYTHAADGSVEWANARWYEYSRLPAQMALSPQGWESLISPEDLPIVTARTAEAFRTGEPYELEMRFKPYGAPDEAYRWHLLRAVPMRDPAGSIVRWAGSTTDVHDRRVAEETMRTQLERELAREHESSAAFQQAALPQGLPVVPGVMFSAMYEAAVAENLVGGDWYDAFRLMDGRIVISVGDVIGNGLSAAVTMAAVRQSIRGAAQVFPDPAAILDAADRALRSEQPDRIVTAFIGILDMVTFSLWYASAGHPPPLLRKIDGSVEELWNPGLPLGLRNFHESGENAAVHLPEAALLVLYTDGLIEATRNIVEGEQRLRLALARADVFDARESAAAIREAVVSETKDDVAILTLRIGPVGARVRRWSFISGDAETATQKPPMRSSSSANSSVTSSATPAAMSRRRSTSVPRPRFFTCSTEVRDSRSLPGYRRTA